MPPLFLQPPLLSRPDSAWQDGSHHVVHIFCQLAGARLNSIAEGGVTTLC